MKKTMLSCVLMMCAVSLNAVTVPQFLKKFANKMTYYMYVDEGEGVSAAQQHQQDGGCKQIEHELHQALISVYGKDFIIKIKEIFNTAAQLNIPCDETTVFSDDQTILEKLITLARYQSARNVLMKFPKARIRLQTFMLLVSICPKQTEIKLLIQECFERAECIDFDKVLTTALMSGNYYFANFLFNKGFQVVDVQGCVSECKKKMSRFFADPHTSALGADILLKLVFYGYIALTHKPGFLGDYIEVDVMGCEQPIIIGRSILPNRSIIEFFAFDVYQHSLAYWIRAYGTQKLLSNNIFEKAIIHLWPRDLSGECYPQNMFFFCSVSHLVGTLNQKNKEYIVDLINKRSSDIAVYSVTEALKNRWKQCGDQNALWVYKKLISGIYKFSEKARIFADIRVICS